MARNRRSLYDIAINRRGPGGIGNTPGGAISTPGGSIGNFGGGGNREIPWEGGPSIAGPYGEQQANPGWSGFGNWAFGGVPGGTGGFWGTESEWAQSFDTWFPGWEINSFGDWYDWFENAPGAPGSGMDFMGNPSDADENNMDWYEWYNNMNTMYPDFMGSTGSNVGGPGDYGSGSNFGDTTVDCEEHGPYYNSNNDCIACCDDGGSIVPECPDGPIFDDSGNCIDCCGTMPIPNQEHSIY
tara:strand:+ start:369 stop:1091 length:723 start_codon:yes stop_codon:yes gene_type:complete